MRRKRTPFVGTALVITLVVGALTLGVWFVHALVERFLSTEQTIAGIKITPYGYRMNGFLTHSFDSLYVDMDGTKIKMVQPKIRASLLGKNKGANLEMQSVDAQILLKENKTQKKEKLELSVPDNLKIPLPLKLKVEQASVSLSDGKKWGASNLTIKNHSETSLEVKANNIQGDYVESPTSLSLNADFGGPRLKAELNLETANDQVNLKVNAPREDLTKIKTSTNLYVSNPKKWIPAQLPKAVPAIGALDVQANADIDLNTMKTKYKAKVKTHVGEFWPLLPVNTEINLDGTQDSIKFETYLRNNEGGLIYLKGAFDTALNGNMFGRVEYMNAEFGPQMMPLDMNIRSIEKYGNTIDVSVETRQGSIINGTVDIEDDIIASFVGNLTPYEPWALDWVGGNVTLEKDTKVNGYFDGHVLHAQVKFNSVLNAYHMKADSVKVSLNLNTEGIVFNKGLIFTPDETFDFDGDVIWGTESPHTSWNIKQQHDGDASVYISFGDSMSIDATANKVNIRTIPFSEIHISEKIEGNVSGKFKQNFATKTAYAKLNVAGKLDAFAVEGNILANQVGDTIFIDQADAFHNKNAVQLSAGFILPNDSNPNFTPTGSLPIQVMHANISARDFSIPLMLESFNDTTLSSGMLNGQLSYQENSGLSGSMVFSDILFSKIDTTICKVRALNLYAQNEKVEINANLDIGSGGWGGNAQILVDNIFSPTRHINITHGSDNGGSAWLEGFLDENLMFNGTLDVNGSWYIPGTLSEIRNTDLHVDISADIKQGLKGITADIRSDTTLIQPPKMNLEIPLFIRGHLENGLAEITEASVKNHHNETIVATASYSLDSMKLVNVDIESESFTVTRPGNTLHLENISGHLKDTERGLAVTAELPYITYNFNHDIYGEASANAHANIFFEIPRSEVGQIKNNVLGGSIIIDKLVYQKTIDIEVTPSAIERYMGMFNNFTAKLRKKGGQEEKISTASPINLNLHISDSQEDSIMVVTPFATFPFSFDIWVFGNTTRPLLRGDITNTNNGFIGVRDLYEFNLNSFLISWNDAPWQQGIIDVTSSQDLHYCSEIDNNEAETCPINLDIQGTITDPQPIPSSNCGTESSAAAIYYNVFLGCIADQTGDENTDWNKLAGKAIGKVISATANKTLGGDYIGDIDMKVMLFDNTSTGDKDSSYVKVPISMNRWIKNMSLVFGYTQDQSDNPTYDQALQFGINYTLPVFQEEEYSHKNHLNPSLSLNALLTSKQYLTNSGTEGNENRVEKNIGVNYTYRFWNPCLLGVGKCENIEIKPEQEESK